MSNEQIMFEGVLSNTEKIYNDSIYCLYNGQYGEHSLDDMKITKNQIGQMLKTQEESYKKYIGKQSGDFLCEKIEYDWGRHKQVWTVKCVLCGIITVKENGYQWSRGKTGSMLCNCRKERKKEQFRTEQIAREKEKKKKELEIANEVGKVYGHYKVIECTGLGHGKCIVKCENCGAERKGCGILKLREGVFPHCDCDRVKYDSPEWIGIRNGHCISVGMDGARVKLKCDCGRERLANPSLYFKSKMYCDCGSPDCKFANDVIRKSREKRENGEKFESKVETLLIENGYKTKHVGKTGDYGVDIVAKRNDGLTIAVQCKCNKQSSVGVSAVQEVYAGGRYYGISDFALVAFGNVSVQAVKMAKKLGVYISDGSSFDYPDDIKKYAEGLIPTVSVQTNEKARKLYELNGEKKTLADWAYLYNTKEYKIREGLEKGLTFETALYYQPTPKKFKQYEVQGYTGNLKELCRHFGIVSAPTAYYRIEHGMSVEDAVLMPKQQSGRPRKK